MWRSSGKVVVGVRRVVVWMVWLGEMEMWVGRRMSILDCCCWKDGIVGWWSGGKELVGG